MKSLPLLLATFFPAFWVLFLPYVGFLNPPISTVPVVFMGGLGDGYISFSWYQGLVGGCDNNLAYFKTWSSQHMIVAIEWISLMFHCLVFIGAVWLLQQLAAISNPMPQTSKIKQIIVYSIVSFIGFFAVNIFIWYVVSCYFEFYYALSFVIPRWFISISFGLGIGALYLIGVKYTAMESRLDKRQMP